MLNYKILFSRLEDLSKSLDNCSADKTIRNFIKTDDKEKLKTSIQAQREGGVFYLLYGIQDLILSNADFPKNREITNLSIKMLTTLFDYVEQFSVYALYSNSFDYNLLKPFIESTENTEQLNALLSLSERQQKLKLTTQEFRISTPARNREIGLALFLQVKNAIRFPFDNNIIVTIRTQDSNNDNQNDAVTNQAPGKRS